MTDLRNTGIGTARAAQRNRTTDIFGRPVTPPVLDDIAVGWLATHATLKYEASSGDMADDGTPIGTPKCGAVVDVYEADGVAMVTVVEDRMRDRELIVRRFDWKVSELDPERSYAVEAPGRHGGAKKLLRAAGRNVRVWDFDSTYGDDFLVASALALTEPERRARAEAKAARTGTRCESGHCVDEHGECFESADHLGVCCWCGTAVTPRTRTKR